MVMSNSSDGSLREHVQSAINKAIRRGLFESYRAGEVKRIRKGVVDESIDIRSLE